ncbi:MAG: alpha/beta hydrolase [Bacteroidetes bacterium]|nr:alpha/beta hydrolase [Bacteroidota bacterium]
MALDSKAKALLTAIAAAGEPDISAIPIEIAREQVEKGYSRMKIPVKPVGSVQDVHVPDPNGSITVRVYTPSVAGPFPVMVFFHGGGWVFFRLDAYDPICTHLCEATGCIIFSVDYRLSPEAKFPVATDDCLAATRWIYEHCEQWNGNRDSIILAGDSAGGNLATVTAMRIRDENGTLNEKPTDRSSQIDTTKRPVIRLAGQILLYPVTDYWTPDKPSYIEFAEGFGLTRDAMKWFWDKYLESASDAVNPRVAPLLAPDLSGLPPTLIIVSGFDPLRDEGIAYANRLKQAGVHVKLSVYEDMIHGFLSYLGILKQAKAAIGEIAGWVKCNSFFL